jgi:hypothetical protein
VRGVHGRQGGVEVTIQREGSGGVRRMNYAKVISVAVSFTLVWSLGASAQGRQVAVTVDDLPYAGGDSRALSPSDAPTAAEVNRKLLAALRQHHVRVTGFVIQQRVEELGVAAGTLFLAALLSTGPVGHSQGPPPAAHILQVPSRVRLVLEPRLPGTTIEPATLARIAQVLQRRLDASEARAAVAESAAGKIVVRASSITDLTQFEELLTQNGWLELRITDGQHRFRDALPEIDRVLGRDHADVRAVPPPNDISRMLGQTSSDNTAGVLSGTLFAGQVPGEFLVHEDRWSFVDSLLNLPAVSAATPPGLVLRWGGTLETRGGQRYRPLYALDARPILTGDDITKASARRDALNHHSVVIFTLSRMRRRSFCVETGRHVRDYLAILLDGRVLGQPPIINDQICGDAQIDLQNAPLADARSLAAVMTGGALPAPLVLVEENVLGADLVNWGQLGVVVILAALGVIGLVLLVSRRGHTGHP